MRGSGQLTASVGGCCASLLDDDRAAGLLGQNAQQLPIDGAGRRRS